MAKCELIMLIVYPQRFQVRHSLLGHARTPERTKQVLQRWVYGPNRQHFAVQRQELRCVHVGLRALGVTGFVGVGHIHHTEGVIEPLLRVFVEGFEQSVDDGRNLEGDQRHRGGHVWFRGFGKLK